MTNTNLAIVSRAEPLLTLNDLKDHLRVVGVQDDNYIRDLTYVASDRVASLTNLQTEDVTFDLTVERDYMFSLDVILPRHPLAGLVSVSADGVDLAVNEVHVFNARSRNPRVCSNLQASSWVVRFRAGHGGQDGSLDLIPFTVTNKVPTQGLQAIRLLVAHWFEFREPILTGTILARIPDTVDALLNNIAKDPVI